MGSRQNDEMWRMTALGPHTAPPHWGGGLAHGRLPAGVARAGVSQTGTPWWQRGPLRSSHLRLKVGEWSECEQSGGRDGGFLRKGGSGFYRNEGTGVADWALMSRQRGLQGIPAGWFGGLQGVRRPGGDDPMSRLHRSHEGRGNPLRLVYGVAESVGGTAGGTPSPPGACSGRPAKS